MNYGRLELDKKEIVPNWHYTLEDFLYTTAPYEELAEYAKNPFVHQRMIEAMSRYAASLGFRQLKLMYREYNKAVKASSAATNNRPNPSNQLICLPPYSAACPTSPAAA